jgi:regulator of protease activity HflC (stomatin/prohibitin superfamily)
MTLWRWDQNPDLDFPAKIPIEGRNYRSRRMIEDFKQRMIRKAIAERDKRRERRRAQAEAAAS